MLAWDQYENTLSSQEATHKFLFLPERHNVGLGIVAALTWSCPNLGEWFHGTVGVIVGNAGAAIIELVKLVLPWDRHVLRACQPRRSSIAQKRSRTAA